MRAAEGVASSRTLNRAAWIGLVAAIILIVAAIVVPWAARWSVFANAFAPLHALWSPHVGPGTIPALVLAGFAIRYARDAAAHVPWRWLLLGAFAVGLLWLVSLALVDGPPGLGAILDSPHEYLPTARSITDVGATLSEYISRIPAGSEHHWPTHIAGHPPGAVLFFWALVQVGAGSWLAAGLIVIVLAATTPVAALVTLRRLSAESAARRAAPFLVMGPVAIWAGVSADGMFGAFAAWGLCCLAFAATARRWWSVAAWGIASGLLLGYCIFLSYGLVLLALLALAVLLIARSWRPLPWAAGGAVAVVVAFAAGGFAWWQAYPVLVERYWDGIASKRPIGYWIWGNIAALAVSAGPLVGSAIAVAIASIRSLRERVSEHRVVVILVLAAAATILVADASGMSKAEVERIWVPFVPWLLIGTALLPERWRRWGFAGQLVFALLVQHLLFTGW